MRIELKKFGVNLMSRPSGKEAFLAAKAYLLPKNKKEPIEIDFSGVEVFSPSWGDEFITPIKKEYLKVKLLHTSNPTVKASLKYL